MQLKFYISSVEFRSYLDVQKYRGKFSKNPSILFFFSFQKYFFFFTSSALCYSILNEVTSSFFIEFLQKKPLYCYIKLPGLDPRDKCIFYYKTRRCCRSVVFMPPKLLFPERIFNLKLVAATTFFGFSLLFI